MDVVKRSYANEVVTRLENVVNKALFDVEQYGSLSYDTDRYKLYAVKTKAWDDRKPTVLITGGVHGYETSGVQGALLFLKESAEEYAKHFNIVCCPCVSPWGATNAFKGGTQMQKTQTAGFTRAPLWKNAQQ